MDAERTEIIKKTLARSGLDAMILRLPENIVLCAETWPLNGFSYLVVTAAEGAVALVAPSCEDEEMKRSPVKDLRFFIWPRLHMPDPMEAIKGHLREIGQTHSLVKARIGFEGNFNAVAPSHNAGETLIPCESSIRFLKSVFPQARWSDATDILHQLRATKTRKEIACLRRAHRVADFGLEKFMKSVKPGVSEAELASIAYRECLTRGVALPGVRHVNVFPQISSGPNSHRAWRPIVTTGKRKLKSGEIAVLELAVCVDGYWADTTRVKCAGKPSKIQTRAFAAVMKARKAAIRSIQAGVSASVPDRICRKILIDSGFEKEVVHLTGHGLGFGYHEPEPFLISDNVNFKLREGHVCSVEPGLYSRKWGGIRIEDNIVVTAKGAAVLTRARMTL